MKRVLLLAAMLMAVVPEHASSCDLVYMRWGLPDADVPRLVGRETGYGEVDRPVPEVGRAVSLRIKIATLLSGRVLVADSSVLPLVFAVNCADHQ